MHGALHQSVDIPINNRVEGVGTSRREGASHQGNYRDGERWPARRSEKEGWHRGDQEKFYDAWLSERKIASKDTTGSACFRNFESFAPHRWRV